MNHLPLSIFFALLTGLLVGFRMPTTTTPPAKKPNIVIVMADQWRAQDLGYMGNREVITPNLDKLAGEAVNARYCVASVPVCAPSRASMLTGQHAHTHGVFYNDRPLRNEAVTLDEMCQKGGYQTGFIGKWHINGGFAKDFGPGRLAPIPVERRQEFAYWRGLECTHDYNNSPYYNEVNQRFMWQQYDAISQTDSAIGQPVSLVAPQCANKRHIRGCRALRGYYAHINALDDYIGRLQAALKGANLDQNTIFVFTSDHGDMLYSQGQTNKQRFWDESIRIPMLVK